MLQKVEKNYLFNPASLVLAFLFPILIISIWLLVSGWDFYINTPDGDFYVNIAQNLLAGNGLRNTIRSYDAVPPPLLPLLIAAILYLFNNQIVYFIVFHYFLLGLTGLLIFFLGFEIFRNELVGLTAVVLFSFSPTLIFSGPQYALTETLFTFLLVALVLWVYRLGIQLSHDWSSPVGREYLVVAILLSIITFVRPHLVLLLPILFILGFILAWKRILAWKTLAISLAIPILLICGNILVNYRTHGKLIVFENYSGLALYIANNPNTKLEFYDTTKAQDFVEPLYFSLAEKEFSEQNYFLMNRAREYMVSHPFLIISRTIKKMFSLFFYPLNRYDQWLMYFSIGGFILSFLFNKRDRWALSLIFLLLLDYSLSASVGVLVSEQRYRHPITSIYLVFAGYFLVHSLSWLRGLYTSLINAL